ncbi:MAG: A/G-specific adenine glycosylase [Pseudomonadota bacterium]
MRDQTFAPVLLDWYDRHARAMPWRVPPSDRRAGQRPDPYQVWLSEIMLQQTTVAAVKDYFVAFTTQWPTVADLAAAKDDAVMAAWAGLGYYARARNLLKCARAVVAEHGGRFPSDHADLLKLPGIGPYTAGAVSAIAFDQPNVVVDGNVERVIARMFDIHTPLPTAKPELTQIAADLTPTDRPGDYAQAVMDLGATLCTPRNPACGICPWRQPCLARQAGTATDLPKKLPKTPKPTRFGTAYVGVTPDGAVLLERRPDKGLLGGMMGFPTGTWAETPATTPPPFDADWTECLVEVRHTFTHFHLILTVLVAQAKADPEGIFTAKSEFRPADLPTVMRKVWNAAMDHL